MAEGVYRADGLGIGVGAVADAGVVGDVIVPYVALGLGFHRPFGRASVTGGAEFRQGLLAVADDGQRHVFRGIVTAHVEADEFGVLGKGGPGAGGEVLQAGADGQHNIRFPGDLVGAVRPGDANRPDVQRMIVAEVGAACDGFDHRDVRGFGKGGEFRHRIAILHAAARDDHRALRRVQKADRFGHFAGVGGLRPDVVHATREEFQWIIIGPALHVLRQGNKGRAAIGGVQHRANGVRQGLDDLCGMRDPIPITRDGLEGIVDAESRVPEVLQLLQHGVGQAGEESISAKHQNGQAVGMGKRGAGQKVGGAGASRRGAEHEATAQPGLGVTGGCKSHALFVLTAIKRQGVFHILKRLAQTCDIAMTKDAKAATTDAMLCAINLDKLVVEVAHNGLGRR